MDNQHTAPAPPTAWWYEAFDDDVTGNEPFIIREAREQAGPDGRVRAVATVTPTNSRKDAEARAAFIVRACNSHRALATAARHALDYIRRVGCGSDQPERIEELESALAAAAGSPT